MKRLILCFIISLVSSGLFAYTSGIAFQTDKNSSMQVVVNGKVCNYTAKTFVRVSGNAGLYHVEIKVLSPIDKIWYMVRKDVTVDKGYEFYYKVNFKKGKRPVLELVKRYPTFNREYSNPVMFPKPLLT